MRSWLLALREVPRVETPLPAQRDSILGKAMSDSDITVPWAPVELRGPLHQSRGRLVAIEGSDGSGKSRFVSHLLARLRDSATCTHVLMPGEHLRAYRYWRALNDISMEIDISPGSQLGLSLMAIGDRLVQQSAVIEPALKQGHVVICERYALTPLVFDPGIPYSALLQKLYRPDLGILLDAPTDVMIERVSSRSKTAVHRQTRQAKDTEVQRFRVLADLNGYVAIDTTRTSDYAELEPLWATAQVIGSRG